MTQVRQQGPLGSARGLFCVLRDLRASWGLLCGHWRSCLRCPGLEVAQHGKKKAVRQITVLSCLERDWCLLRTHIPTRYAKTNGVRFEIQ